MVPLALGDWQAEVLPYIGGGLARLTWAGHDVLRPAPSGIQSPLDLACFPLVPYSNRISGGWGGLASNVVGTRYPLHGVGWLEPWDVVERGEASIGLRLVYDGEGWPWPFAAELRYTLAEDRLVMDVSVTQSRRDGEGEGSRMPTGLGFHPYFPRAHAEARLDFEGYWETDADCLPTKWTALPAQPDWLGDTLIDTVFTGRRGTMAVSYPWGTVALQPSDTLPFTVIYTPPSEEYFCIEPVSHSTDAINRAPHEMVMLEPGETMSARLEIAVKGNVS